ncbi:MAG: membrane protein insertase YidC [Calothrix sp. SM1_5_4]|nr:membrane protein insertase YidC [Calothrix sp. SM1_5_4]
MEIVPEKYLINVRVATSGRDDRFVGLTTVLTEEVEEYPSGNFLMPQFEKQEFYVQTTETTERVTITKEDLQQKSWNKVQLASVGSQYFTQALLDKSPVMPEAKADVSHKGQSANMVLQYPVLNPGQDFLLEYSAFVGPKDYSLLRQVDAKLAGVVDFGFFDWIARHILLMLRWFYSVVGNWGMAIICLTVLVRICVLPFNVYSYKSMKKMQDIQPQIQALREKYKDNQQQQQQEMMQLMRENRVNPLGGCLPVLLQFPIFIALYQVLGHSIELYQAPFALWIHDLSLKDPYYILPVLMGLTMFVQQKITPNTMDPAQAKVLLMMPLIFTFFMVSLPSGLTLYMLVGAVFSVAQQMYFMKSSPPVTAGT